MAKPFSFTYTKLKNFETCGRQHYHVDILREPGLEASGDAIDYGNRVHKALAEALKTGNPVPQQMKYLQYWVDHVNQLPGQKFIEDGWGLDKDFNETAYFGNFAWCRLKVDAAVVGEKVGWLIDWKTGKRLEEPLQLWIGAAVMFQKFPQLKTIDSMFVWLKEDDGKNSHECISAEVIKRSQIEDVWGQILPRVEIYEKAVSGGVFPPKPGYHCRWCRVQSCEFFGKGQ